MLLQCRSVDRVALPQLDNAPRHLFASVQRRQIVRLNAPFRSPKASSAA